MEPELWRRVEELCQHALELDASRRAEFLEHACANDEVLRREVESLLLYEERAGHFIELPALEVVGRLLATDRVPTEEAARLIGTTVSHYRVIEELGGGGMGVVYKAEDTRLHRFVALKFLVDDVAQDAQWLSRFQREAQAASGLNHPNICTVYDIGEHQGNSFIAMEFLDGQTLKHLIAGKPLRTDQILDVGAQIAAALDAAHKKGIIHRDVKPANIFVLKHGQVKLLDFGVAKLGQQSPTEGRPVATGDASGELHFTETGVAVGTVAYMSPEQVRGEELDARTDLFSFGVVLYEMATGVRPFNGHTSGAISAAILHDIPPSTSSFSPTLPSKLDAIINRTLTKNRDLRYQHAADIRADIDRLTSDADSARMPITWRKILPSAVVLCALLAIGSRFYFHRRPALAEKDTIVLADFANGTGDSVFDDTLKTALSISLRQSPFLNVLSDRQVAKTLQLMTLAANRKLTPDLAREVCQRAGSKAYIAGSITRLGAQYVLALEAVSCQDGDTLAQEQVTAVAKEKVLDALGKAASKMRGELGESLVTVRKYDVPLVTATTPSLDALKAYSLASKAMIGRDPAAALPYSQHAIELDPDFAMAYLQVGATYFTLSELGRASEYYVKAFQLRERASEGEKLVITACYYGYATGQLDKAAQTYQEVTEIYPRGTLAYTNLAVLFEKLGQYEKSAEAARTLRRLDPDNIFAYVNLAIDAVALQRFDEARQIIQEAHSRKLDDYLMHDDLYALAFLAADSAGMAEQQHWFAGQPVYENYGLAYASDTEAYGGHTREARVLTRRAVDSAIRVDNIEDGAVYQINAALREAAYGNAVEAKQSAIEALRLAPASRRLAAEAALALAMTDETARAESLAEDLDRRFPLDTEIQSLWLPAIRAQLALSRRDSGLSLTELQAAASPIEFGKDVGCLYPAYVRGKAYLAAGQGNAAAAAFQKILDHSGVVGNCWTGALAHLGVARANALQAKTARGPDANAARVRALAAYKDFLTLWKDADPDIPILEEAKAEYAKLQSLERM